MSSTVKSFYQNQVVLRPQVGSFTSEGEFSRWSNEDLDPVPPSKKKWQWFHVGGFWVAEGFNVALMQTPSSAVALGLNPGLAIVACLIGNILVTIPCCSAGYIGAKFSLNFPVISRASFGMRGAYAAMVVRAVVCIIWYGVQTSLGGNAVRCMLEAIWPSFKTWHLHSLPESSSITAPDLLSFIIFWLVTLPFLYLGVPALRWLFMIKVVIMPFFGVALFTWALTAGHGWGPLFSIPNNITNGWSVGYAFCYTITAAIAGNATFGINMSDITRYANTPRAGWLPQVIALPVVITLTELLGTVMAASAQVVYGQVLWNPLDVVALWDNRSGKFFAGLLFAFANIATNVAGNSIPFANDLTGMFPKWINIRRGQFICAILGFAICPWEIEAKATRFLAFLNGYSVFLGPIAGILMADYWLVRKAKGYNVYNLYKPGGLYWFTAGWNYRAILAMLIGMAPLLPGLIWNINPGIGGISRGVLEFYTLSWLDGLVLAGLSYYLLFLISPFETQTDEEDKAQYFVEGGDLTSDQASISKSSGDEKMTDVKTRVEAV